MTVPLDHGDTRPAPRTLPHPVTMSRTLLVTVDSLRLDHYEHLPETRGFLDGEHDHAYATFPSTLGSFPAIIGGEYAVTAGLPAGTSVVPHLDGYRVGITTNHLLSAGYGYDDGFDAFESPKAGGDSLKERVSAMVEMGSTTYKLAALGWNAVQQVSARVREPGRTFRPAGEVIEAFDDRVAGREDWFGWLHFMEPHHPYEPSDGPVSRVRAQNLTRQALAGLADESEAEMVRRLYRREVEELDRALAGLWDSLPSDVRVIFTADHGELLGEDGLWGHPGVLREELLHVPFATRNFDVELGELVSLIDVPTMLRGQPHGAGDVGREVAFASYGDVRAAIDTTAIVTTEDDSPASRTLRNTLDRFDVESGLTRDDALYRDLEVLGYK